MSLSANTKEVLLTNLFYSPSTQYTSIKTLHDAVKNKGITYNEVRDFIQRQETSQLFKKPTRTNHYFPIFAKHKYEILQIDLIYYFWGRVFNNTLNSICNGLAFSLSFLTEQRTLA